MKILILNIAIFFVSVTLLYSQMGEFQFLTKGKRSSKDYVNYGERKNSPIACFFDSLIRTKMYKNRIVLPEDKLPLEFSILFKYQSGRRFEYLRTSLVYFNLQDTLRGLSILQGHYYTLFDQSFVKELIQKMNMLVLWDPTNTYSKFRLKHGPNNTGGPETESVFLFFNFGDKIFQRNYTVITDGNIGVPYLFRTLFAEITYNNNLIPLDFGEMNKLYDQYSKIDLKDFKSGLSDLKQAFDEHEKWLQYNILKLLPMKKYIPESFIMKMH